jgi:hypothetical protein
MCQDAKRNVSAPTLSDGPGALAVPHHELYKLSHRRGAPRKFQELAPGSAQNIKEISIYQCANALQS